MSTLSIVCDNCGAKYRIPEADERAQAKCQKCGSVIDVSRQRSAAGDGDAPSAAKPAAARPAIDRSKEPLPTPTTRPVIGQRAERPRRPERGDANDRPSRGARRSAKGDDAGKPKWPLFVGIGVVVLAVILFFVLRKGH